MIQDVSGLTRLPGGDGKSAPRNGVSGETENDGLIQATTGDIVVDLQEKTEDSETMQVTTGDLIVERKERTVPDDDGEVLDLSTGDMIVERRPEGQATRKSTKIGMPPPPERPRTSRPHPPPQRRKPEGAEEPVELPSGEYRLDEE
jgi:hypothetical protein